MAIELAIFGAIYSLSNPILRKVIAGNESKELSKQGKLVNWLGKSILVLIGIVTIVYVSIVEVEIGFIYWINYLLSSFS